MAEGSNYIIRYISDVSQVVSEAKKIEKINKTLVDQYGKKAPQAVKILGNEIRKTGQQKIFNAKGVQVGTTAVEKMGTTFRDANGKLKTFTETQKVLKNGTVSVSKSISDVDTKTVSFGQNLARLAKRALLTIPVWFAIRQAISLVSNTFRNGIKNLAEFDRALQKAKRSLTGSSAEIEQNYSRLREEVTKLSLDTGVSVENITRAFQRFATVGFDFETSMTGATEATKLAITLFGDAEENANALARAFRVLVDNSGNYGSQSDQLQRATALLAELYKDNAFEINEMAGALERFAPVANIANFSMEETIKVLALLQTAGIRGTRAGRLLSTAMLQLDKNFDKIRTQLGLNINPQLTTTYDRFLIVTKAIRELNEVDSLKATQAVQTLFGGVRGSQTIQALVAMGDELENILAKEGDVAKFSSEFDDMTNTLGKLTERFTNARKEMGKAFVTGVVGGEDFRASLQSIVEFLEDATEETQAFGRAIRTLFQIVTIVGVPTIFKDVADDTIAIYDDLSNQIEAITDKINRGLKEGLSASEIEEGFKQLEELKIFTDEQNIEINIKALENGLNRIKEVQDDVTDSSKKYTDELQKQEISLALQEDINDILLASQNRRLKEQGFLTSEILKAEQALRDKLGIEEKLEDKLERQLQIQEAITKEKRLESELGNETIKLYRIAQEQGTDIAQRIGDVLSGEVDFSSFVRRGGEAVETFKKEFSDIFEQQQALAFFRGDTVPGARGLRGGTRIAIEEEGIRRPTSAITRAVGLDQSRLEALARREMIQQKVDVSAPVTINTSIDVSDLDAVGDQVVDKIAKEVQKSGSKMNIALAKALYNKQTRSV